MGVRASWGSYTMLALVLACETSDGSQDEAGDEPMVIRSCPPPAGFEERPASIQDVVDRINALPMPVSLPCFVESLPRPLRGYATSSSFSAQPASGAESPRVFLFEGPLVLTVVPAGQGSHLLEMSELLDDRLSLKAELEFPVQAEVADAEPFEQVRNEAGGATNCATCHGLERAHEAIEGAYVSEALQPDPELAVPLSFVRQSARDCDAGEEPQRCAILQALFLHGDVETAEFPAYRICRGF